MGLTVKKLANQNFAAAGGRGNEKMGVFVAGVPSSLAPVLLLPRSSSPSPSPFTPATQAKYFIALVCRCFKFESDLLKLRLQKTEKSKLADFSIQTADPKRTRCFVNMQQMARQLSLVFMFSIDRIKFYSEWKRM